MVRKVKGAAEGTPMPSAPKEKQNVDIHNLSDKVQGIVDRHPIGKSGTHSDNTRATMRTHKVSLNPSDAVIRGTGSKN